MRVKRKRRLRGMGSFHMGGADLSVLNKMRVDLGPSPRLTYQFINPFALAADAMALTSIAFPAQRAMKTMDGSDIRTAPRIKPPSDEIHELRTKTTNEERRSMIGMISCQ